MVFDDLLDGVEDGHAVHVAALPAGSHAAHHLRAAARAHDTAAESLERHLGEVDRLKEAIAEAEQKLGGRIAEAQHHVDASAYDDAAATDHDRTLVSSTLPPSGHADWLHLELPGS